MSELRNRAKKFRAIFLKKHLVQQLLKHSEEHAEVQLSALWRRVAFAHSCQAQSTTSLDVLFTRATEHCAFVKVCISTLPFFFDNVHNYALGLLVKS